MWVLALLACAKAPVPPPAPEPARAERYEPPPCPAGLIRSCGCRGAVTTEETVCPCITEGMLEECERELPR